MNQTVTLREHPIEVELTASAERAAATLEQPLHVEMELYFSCLIRKKLQFRSLKSADSVAITDKLSLDFRPVMTAHCSTDYEGDEPPVTDFPIARQDSFMPHWVRIDYHNGHWQGDFGYN